MGQPFVRAREAEHEHEQALAEPFAAAQVSDEDDVSRDQGGGEGAITRRPAGGPRSWSAAMTAADTVASEYETHGTNGEPSWRHGGSSRQGALASEGEQFWTPDDWSERQAAYRQLWGPPAHRLAPRQALGQPYVWDGGRSDPDEIERAAYDGDPEPEPSAAIRPRPSADPLTGFAPTTERAVIGDELRELAAWCQIGACIARHADPQALGEVDIRHRAVAAGWCVDLFGRLICPSCQQTIPVWSALPLVGRDRAAGQPPVTAEAQFGRHRRIRWPTPRGVDPVP